MQHRQQERSMHALMGTVCVDMGHKQERTDYMCQ